MGISDDIVPRRHHRPHAGHEAVQKKSKPAVEEDKDEIDVKSKPAEEKKDKSKLDIEKKPEAALEEEREEKDAASMPDKVSAGAGAPASKGMRGEKSKSELAEHFFSDNSSKKSPDQDGESEKEQEARHYGIWALLILFLALAVILIYQNFSEIRSLFKSEVKQTEKVASKETTAEKNIEPQDYTTPAKSETPATQNSASSTAKDETKPAATTTTTPTIDKSTIKVQVLNGNGVSGTAAAVTKTLQDAGFTVGSTTNAKNFNYNTTIIYFKTGKNAEADLVKAALTGRTVTTENSDTIAKTYDLVVVVGKK